MNINTIKSIAGATAGGIVALGVTAVVLDKVTPIYRQRKLIDEKIAANKIAREELRLDIQYYNSDSFTGTRDEHDAFIKEAVDKMAKIALELIDLIQSRPSYI